MLSFTLLHDCPTNACATATQSFQRQMQRHLESYSSSFLHSTRVWQSRSRSSSLLTTARPRKVKQSYQTRWAMIKATTQRGCSWDYECVVLGQLMAIVTVMNQTRSRAIHYSHYSATSKLSCNAMFGRPFHAWDQETCGQDLNEAQILGHNRYSHEQANAPGKCIPLIIRLRLKDGDAKVHRAQSYQHNCRE